MKIYPNLQEAIKALEQYRDARDKLSSELGVWELCDDSMAGIYMTVNYYDENRKVQSYTDY